MSINHIVIGTANFGSKYGFKKKIYSKKNLREIFRILNKKKIKFFDTAHAYDKSEKILGNNLKKAKIYTKFTLPLKKNNKIEKNLKKLFKISQKNLKKNFIECVLIHNTEVFLKNKNIQSEIISFFKKLKKEKKIKKFGFSIYSPHELKEILKIFIPDVVQLPLNILDQRFLNADIIRLIKRYNINVYARSIFLRGKILRDNQFKSRLVNKKIRLFKIWCEKKKIDRFEACISFAKNYKFINKIVVGFDDIEQLNKIIKAFKKKKNYAINQKFKVQNFKLIDLRKIR